MRVRAHAPGRVNLIGDHTDYAGGLALPMAIDLGTTVMGETHGDRVVLRSRQQEEPATLPLRIDDPAAAEPGWARYVAGVIAELEPDRGFIGVVDSTLPLGAGLSSSAALEVAVALALGFEGTARDLAMLCQRAEQRASGVPCGAMDQLASACGRQGHALFIDFAALDIDYVPMPPAAEVVVVHSGDTRTLVDSAYDERRSGNGSRRSNSGTAARPSRRETGTDRRPGRASSRASRCHRERSRRSSGHCAAIE